MMRAALRFRVVVCFVAVSLLLWRTQGKAMPLDKEGDIKLGVRTYVNARIGTEATHDGALNGKGTADEVATSATFPHSDAGHLRQNRLFLEVELNHDLSRMVKEGIGPLSLLNDLPFKVKGLGYHFTFRGEGEGLYDWGGKEYSTAREFYKAKVTSIGNGNGLSPPVSVDQQAEIDVPGTRRQLRKLGSERERLFQAYAEASIGDLFLRVGRQILSWGETDGFQLMDHINPIDSSFGGFLISLDERRIPLDMVRAQYYLGNLGPVSEMFLEGYGAIDNKVGFYPGTPAGSAWTLPSLGAPGNSTKSIRLRPARTINDARGGARLVFNAFDATFSLAHYYTNFDTPGLQIETSPTSLTPRSGTICQGRPCGFVKDFFDDGFPTHALQTAPKVQISGASTTFAVPQLYTIVRSEVAYFKDEPAFTQGQLDPFIFQPLDDKGNGCRPAGDPNRQPECKGLPDGKTTGGRRLRDSVNAVLGLDINQWVRFINPNQTILFSTQFFFKHIRHAGDGAIWGEDGRLNPNREVLPITLIPHQPNTKASFLRGQLVEPIFISQPADQYLQTLFITTSYRSGTITPAFLFFYDWGGSLVYLPSLTLSRDPFRFEISYSILDAHIYKGGSGVSLLKDRDSVEFRIEYVI